MLKGTFRILKSWHKNTDSKASWGTCIVAHDFLLCRLFILITNGTRGNFLVAFAFIEFQESVGSTEKQWLDWLSSKLRIVSLDEWYRVSHKQIHEALQAIRKVAFVNEDLVG